MRETGDSARILVYTQVIGRYFFRLGQKDSALYYAKAAHGWADTFRKASYPMFAVMIDTANRSWARPDFRFRQQGTPIPIAAGALVRPG